MNKILNTDVCDTNLPVFYQNIIKKHSLLTREQEKQLFEKIVNQSHYCKEDIKNAIEIVAYSNQKLVLKYAFKYYHKYIKRIDLMDLISYGNVGLMKSVFSFNPLFNVKFSSYATFAINRTILYCIARYSSVVRKEINRKNMSNFQFPIIHSLDRRIHEDDNNTLTYKDVLVDKNLENQVNLLPAKSIYDDAMNSIDKEERKILKYFCEDQYSLSKIGRIYHFSRETMRKRFKNIIRKIKFRVKYK